MQPQTFNVAPQLLAMGVLGIVLFLALLLVFLVISAWLLNFSVKLAVGEGDTLATALKVTFSSIIFGIVKDVVVFLLGNSIPLQTFGAVLGLIVFILLLRYFYSLTTFESIKVILVMFLVALAIGLVFGLLAVAIVLVVTALVGP